MNLAPARPAASGDIQGGIAPLLQRVEQDVHLFERLVFMARQNR
jgi:hypothetical protein